MQEGEGVGTMSNVPHTPRCEGGASMTTAEAMDELERLRQRG